MELSERARQAQIEIDKVTDFFAVMGALADQPDSLDFTFGNPHEMPLPELVEAMRAQVEPQTVDWFAYKSSVRTAQQAVADGLTAELSLSFEPDDITMTQGAFGAIELAFHLLADAGDEVIIPVPGWFCYAPMLRAANLVPVEAPLDPVSFDLDVDAIAGAITPHTRIVVVNSPANPTGRVYSRARLEALADILDEASERIGRRIWLLSDEPYRRIRFDDIPFTSPAAAYPWTMIDYSYGKVLLAPGQRLGYLALSPSIPEADKQAFRSAFTPVQLATGWNYPNAIMQYAAPALESVSIDMVEYTAKRNRMYGALSDAGYEITRPEGTFYLWGRAPGGDGDAFCTHMALRGVHLMPGSLFDRPEHFRISLTATMETIEKALPTLVDAATFGS
ncbi:aminotransferase class I/II-fold pyridoxal phosphate-dependent enzyme [Demequina aurantiaca]|uniref:aminotransferase class I/II-fold pyridoxal phosphate-dependent enzyme n=1 Tax=Demequina aurantiaca TaxID=676200 RepID=UPI003D340718